MKLQSILYSEAAKTPEYAVEKELGIIVRRDENKHKLVLIDVGRIRQYLETGRNILKEFDVASNIIVGMLTFNMEEDKTLYAVGTSAAVNKFGPMVYDAALAVVYPNWLHSDHSLTSFSKNVWDKYFLRSDVERKFLGEFKTEYSLVDYAMDAVYDSAEISATRYWEEFSNDTLGNPTAFKRIFDKANPKEKLAVPQCLLTVKQQIFELLETTTSF